MSQKTTLLALLALTAITVLLFTQKQSESEETVQTDALVAQFNDFRKTFNRTYSSLADMEYRMNVFTKTLEDIERHNSASNSSYTLGINQFSDMSFEEFISFQTVDLSFMKEIPVRNPDLLKGSADRVVNWTERGVVTPVKDMRNCNANYAFGVNAIVEEAYALHEKTAAPVLSDQEVVDCSTIYDNLQCKGGSSTFSMYYVRDFGVNLESDYPYTGKDQGCRKDIAGKGRYRPKKWWTIGEGPENMVNQLRIQPTTAGFVIKPDFKSYKSGVYNNNDCLGEPHYLVNAVGFNLDAKEPFFLAKNFWGTNWGENGYFRVAMAEGRGVCGFTGPWYSTYAIIEPKEQL